MLNSMSSPLIDLNRVTKAYKTDAGLFMALKGIDLHINAGEFVAIIGKSGSGKTTLINMITGLDRPTSGEILVGGAAVEKLGENQLAIWRGGYCSAWGSKTNTIDTGMEAKPPAWIQVEPKKSYRRHCFSIKSRQGKP